jgi:signal transduction histidine kinase
MDADVIYTQAFVHLSHLEGEALLKDAHQKLEKAQLYIERLDKSKSNFISVAAHELRTPLTLVEGYANMLRIDKTLAESNPQFAAITEGVNQGVKRLREIISDMIDVSQIELRVFKLYFQPVWLPQVLDALERNVRDVLLQRHLNFIIETETIPIEPTFADHERLLQAVMNVVMNAIKYTPDGGTIRITARQLPGFTDIMVIDTGIGISATDLPHIFGMFSSLTEVSRHSSGKTKFRGGGPGLGLFISKGILDGHGGTIWAQSPGYDEKLLRGSTFHLMIPMRDTPPDDNIVTVLDADLAEEEL